MSEIIVSGSIESGRLQQFVDVVTALVDEGRVHFNDDFMHTQVVDPANVAMHLPVELDAAGFESYDAPGAATIGLNFNRLDEILGVADDSDLVEIEIDMETRHLHLSFNGVEQSIAMIDPDAIREEPDTPDDLDLPNMAVIEGRDFARALEIAELNSDHVDVLGRPDAEQVLVFRAEGDTDEGRVGFGIDDCVGTQIQDRTESIFSLEYLQEFASPMAADAEVEIWFGHEFPIRLSWSACEGHLSVESMLAPRIQSE